MDEDRESAADIARDNARAYQTAIDAKALLESHIGALVAYTIEAFDPVLLPSEQYQQIISHAIVTEMRLIHHDLKELGYRCDILQADLVPLALKGFDNNWLHDIFSDFCGRAATKIEEDIGYYHGDRNEEE